MCSLHQGRISSFYVDAKNVGTTRQELHVLPQCRDKGLLAQRLRDGCAYRFKRLRLPGVARQNFNHMQTKPAVYKAREHAHLGMAKNLFGKFWRAVGLREPAKFTTVGSAGAIGHGAGGL